MSDYYGGTVQGRCRCGMTHEGPDANRLARQHFCTHGPMVYCDDMEHVACSQCGEVFGLIAATVKSHA